MIAELLFDKPAPQATASGYDDTYTNVFTRVFSSLGRRTTSGEMVTPMRAMQLSAVYTCVTLLSRVMASLPIKVVKKEDGKTIPVDDHSVTPLLTLAPNPEMNVYRFVSLIITHMALRGNFYAEIVYDGMGNVKELWPLHPDLVNVERKEVDGKSALLYEVEQDGGQPVRLRPDEVVHVMWHSDDGVIGTCPIDASSESIGHGLAAQKFGARFFANDATPPIAIEVPVAPKDKDQADMFLDSWADRGVGEKRHRAAMLPPQAKLHQLSITNEQAQYLETSQFTDRRIAAMYGTASVYLNDPDKDTYASGNQKERDLKTYTLGPLATNIEIEFRTKLFRDQPNMRATFGFATLLRGDPETRATIRQIDIQSGVISPNEARQDEDRDPVDGLDYYNNTKQAETIVPGQPAPEPNTEAKSPQEVIRPVARDAIGRVVAKEVRQLRARLKRCKSAMSLCESIVLFYDGGATKDDMIGALTPVGKLIAELAADTGCKPVPDRSDEFAAKYAMSSRAQLDAVIRKAAPKGEQFEAVEDCLVQWEQSRADKATAELLGESK